MKTRITIVAAVGKPQIEPRPTPSLRTSIDKPRSGARGRILGGAIPPSLVSGVCLALLTLAGVTRAVAGWTPPESSVTPPAVVTLDAFAASYLNGVHPVAPLVVGPDGALYGSTAYGGANGLWGTLFRLETNGTFTKLHDFNLSDGASPQSALVAGPDGALYGSTLQGGANDLGTLFRLETNGRFTKLHDFRATDGAYPSASLTVGPDGALYGSTAGGGTNDQGTLFRLETSGAFTSLHDFNRANGANPEAPLVVGPDGALYGSTSQGGTGDLGTLLRVETNGAVTKLHDFDFGEGVLPQAALVVGPDGSLYGSTSLGGPRQGGILFKLVLNRAPADSDGDGVPDAIDQCPSTPPGAVVDTTGCSIAQLIPCDGPLSGGTWKNHGQYVRAVIGTATDFLKAHLITRGQWAQVVTGAAHSKCGWNRRSDHEGDRDWHRDWDCDRDREWGRERGRDRD